MKVILLLSILIISSCKKTEITASAIGDEVVGTYTDNWGHIIQVSKTGNRKYEIHKLSPSPFPEFTMQYSLNLFGVFSYDVPVQGNIVSDSSFASYYDVQHNFQFTIKENTGAKWRYVGFK